MKKVFNRKFKKTSNGHGRSKKLHDYEERCERKQNKYRNY